MNNDKLLNTYPRYINNLQIIIIILNFRFFAKFDNIEIVYMRIYNNRYTQIIIGLINVVYLINVTM